MKMNNKYNVILADPPWQDPHRWGRNTGKRTADQYYKTLPLQDICSFPVMDITSDNCVLFLWVTWPCIFYAEKVIKAWGFDYRTIGWIWIKSKKDGTGFAFGMGNYTRANSEPCLIAVKGSCPVAVHDEQAFIYSPRLTHSQKPHEQYSKIERLYPNANYLELFARYHKDGWDVWGNEVDSDIDLMKLHNEDSE